MKSPPPDFLPRGLRQDSLGRIRIAAASRPGDGSDRGKVLGCLRTGNTRAELAACSGLTPRRAAAHLSALEGQGSVVREGRGVYTLADRSSPAYPRTDGLLQICEYVRSRFVAFGFDVVKPVKVIVDAKADDGGRHVAACHVSGNEIIVAPRLATFPDGVILAVVAHEFGHATDFHYPGKWVKDGWGKPDLALWQRRSQDEVERAADQIAEAAMGLPIRYAGECMIQTFEAEGARPRPKGLR